MTTEDSKARARLRRARERAASSYDRSAVVPEEVGRRMMERLDLVLVPDGPILDAGCATGAVTRMLARRLPHAPVVALDSAAGMIDVARAAAPVLARMVARWKGTSIRWIVGEVDALPIRPGSCAMVWSNLALQWQTDPAAAFAQMHRALKPGGLLMFSTLGPDTLKELRSAYARIDDRPRVRRFPDMHDLGDLLVHAGFADPVMDMETLTLTFADATTLLREIKEQGSIDAESGNTHGLGGRRVHAQLLDGLERERREGRIPATFEVVYGHAWKPDSGPAVTADGRQVIRIHRPTRDR
jgi:malonyl-CoA O-methyltransferase